MRRLALLLLLLPAPAPAEEEGAELGESRLDGANRAAAEQVYRTVAEPGSGLRNRLRGLRKEDVVVVGGLFDFLQELLVAWKQPHTVITPEELDDHALDPERAVVLLNCHLMDRDFPATDSDAPRPDAKEAAARLRRVLRESGLAEDPDAPGKAIRERFREVMYFAGTDYSVEGLRRLGRFVRDGGWLYSSDWAVLAVERACPGSFRWTGHTTFEETVEVKRSAGARGHPLLEGVFPDKGKVRWWIEKEAYLFAVKGRHRRLVESRQLAARYHGKKLVVVLKEYGEGRILHSLAHAYLQRGDAADIAPMHRLLLNFLIERSVMNWKRERAARD